MRYFIHCTTLLYPLINTYIWALTTCVCLCLYLYVCIFYAAYVRTIGNFPYFQLDYNRLQQESALNLRENHLCGLTIKEVLIKWKYTSLGDVTCEPTSILQQFPHLQP